MLPRWFLLLLLSHWVSDAWGIHLTVHNWGHLPDVFMDLCSLSWIVALMFTSPWPHSCSLLLQPQAHTFGFTLHFVGTLTFLHRLYRCHWLVWHILISNLPISNDGFVNQLHEFSSSGVSSNSPLGPIEQCAFLSYPLWYLTRALVLFSLSRGWVNSNLIMLPLTVC